jgi:hypothetical protein
MRRVRVTNVAGGNARSRPIIYSECVSVALVTQHEKRMPRIILVWVDRPAPQ